MNLKDLKNKHLLIFGKSRSFREEEFFSQLNYHNINMVQEFDEKVVYVIEGRMMTPYEQNESEKVYENESVNFLTIDKLEEALAKAIDEDTLLMSIKLSHDKDRLKDFIKNSMISDALFFRLLKMFSWGSDDFFENDDNRDISAAFISRFYKNIERNHNVQYSTTGFIHLVAQSQDSELLGEIYKLKPLSFHPKIKISIAMSLYCNEKLQEKLFRSGDIKILEALSLNKKLKESLIIEFLKDVELASNVASSIELSESLFKLLEKESLSLALNDTLTFEMQKTLLAQKDTKVNTALSLNNSIDKKIVEKLLLLKEAEIELLLYENAATPVEILEEAYKNSEFHMALAKNESTPIDILYQLQLDSRYERYVKTNAGFGKHIQTENIGWL